MISGLIWACISLIIMKLDRNLSYKSRMTPIDFRVKGQSYRTLVIDNGFWTYYSLYFTFCRETCKIYFPWVNIYPYWFFGQKNKGQGQRTLVTENGFWIMYECVSTWNMQVMFPIFQDHIRFMYIFMPAYSYLQSSFATRHFASLMHLKLIFINIVAEVFVY